MNISNPTASHLRVIVSVLFLIANAGLLMAQKYEKVFSFTDHFAEGPFSANEGGGVTSMMEGSDGSFYGTTESTAKSFIPPSSTGPGTIFKMAPDGYLTTLFRFPETQGDPRGTNGTLQAIGIDDRFYGITNDGGVAGNGSIFRISRSGSFQTIAEFTGTGGAKKGRFPKLIFQGPDRNFYGVTSAGGTSDAGTVFKITPSGFFTTLVEFTGNSGDRMGRAPAKLFVGSDGTLYGVTESGGTSDNGTVFKLAISGGEFSTLAEFTGISGSRIGSHPNALLETSLGVLVGTTTSGGSNNLGSVFRISVSGGWTTLLQFNGSNGANPAHDLVKDTSGVAHGITQGGGAAENGLIYKVTDGAGVQTVLNLDMSQRQAGTKGPLVAGREGKLYASITGASDLYGVSDTITEIGSDGIPRNLASFSYNHDLREYEGLGVGNLLVSKNGVLYGTTAHGGYVGEIQAHGMIFRIGSAGTETLTGFGVPRVPSSPLQPHAGVILGSDGGFYGTSKSGGTNNLGTVFRVSPAGEMKVLHSFNGTFRSEFSPAYDGAYPVAGLTQGNDLDLYGTSTSVPVNYYFGYAPPFMAFRITKSGEMVWKKKYREPLTFSSSGSEVAPDLSAALLQGSDGNFYGRGYMNTVNSLVRLTPSGITSNFPVGGDIYTPQGKFLEVGPSGSTYFMGTSAKGGAYGNGSIFRTTADGEALTVANLHDSDEFIANTEWQSFNIGSRSGIFTYSYTITPKQSLMDGITGLSLGDSDSFSDLGCSIRLYTNGRFEARNGNAYAAVNDVLYQAGQDYQVLMTVNIPAKTYSATVNGVPVASNFSFRTEQMGVTGLDRFAIIKVSGDFTVKNLTNVPLPKQGKYPLAGLIRSSSDGDFYGCASEGGTYGHGTVFRMTPAGVISKLVDFSGNGTANNGSRPVAELLERPDGKFYGVTSAGGAQDKGTLFRISPDGVLETLFDFESDQQDSKPLGALVTGTDGNLYGTSSGGSGGSGSVFRLVFDGPPAIYPMAAELVSNNEVLLHGKFNARGKTTRVDLEYGTDGSTFPGKVTLTTSLSGYQTAESGTSLSGLIRGITYSYRFRAKNAINEETIGPIQTFDTIGPPTAVVTEPTQIKKLTAILNGTVRAGNATTFVTFEYGIDGNSFPYAASASPVNGSNEILVSESVPVAGGTTYYFRISASNSAGTSVSGVRTFTTLTEPTADIGPAKSLSTTSARLTGTVNPQGAGTDVVFEYWTGSPMPAIPSSIPATTPHLNGIGSQQVTAVLPNLQQSVVYSYRIRATSDAGSGWSPVGNFSPDILSGFTQSPPGTPESSFGVVLVTLTPSDIGAGWRFAGEQIWRASGFPATGLTNGDRLIEFRPVIGKITPPAEPVTVISGGAAVFLTRNYEDSSQPGSGSITVTLKPDSLVADSRAGWRLLKPGENTDAWRASGDTGTLENLQPGNYLIEFKPIVAAPGEPQFATPRPTQVIVDDGTASAVTTIYYLKDAQTGQPPTLVPFETASTHQQLPYAWLGQIRSDGGSSSGFVVKPTAGGATVVATAGHVVFDDATLSLVTNLQWIFQRDSISHEPKPLVPRGAHLLDDYAAARSGAVPGQGTSQSQNRDAAALFFNADPGRGGNAGFLASDAIENEFLKSDSLKTLAGYPVDGDEFSAGRLYATAPINVHFSRVIDTDEFGVPFRTYTTPDIRGVGGMSGGPLCVQFEGGNYYPAAIYLGGNNQTIVRAIDSKIIAIFNRAVVSSTSGDNNTGGGITLSSSTSITGNSPGQGALRVVIKPDAVRAMGAGWRIGSSGSYRTSGQSQAADAGTQVLQLAPVTGYEIPAGNLSVTIVEGKQRDIVYTYVDINDPPTLSNVSSKMIEEDTATAAIPLTLNDADNPDSALVMSATTSDPTLVPKANIVFGGSGSNRTVTVTPSADRNGSATLTLTVSDGKLTASRAFVLTVNPVNDAPTITPIANRNIALDTATEAIPLTVGDIDTPVGTLTLVSASSNPDIVPTGAIVFGGSDANRSVTVTPASGQIGSALITVTVSDGILTASSAFTLTVTGTARETWRFASFGTASNTGTAADTADPDGDGSPNLSEYAAGTDPNNAYDVFKILTSTKNATTFTVTAAGKASRSYTLERRATLDNGPWTPVASMSPLATDAPLTLTDTDSPQNSTFYRLRVTAP